jgi:hypothetical protein
MNTAIKFGTEYVAPLNIELSWSIMLHPKNRSYPAPASAGGGDGKTVFRVIRAQM